MLAIESLAAIFAADLPKYEKVVLAVLLCSAYGPQKKAKLRVDHLEIADILAVDPRIVRRAVKGLVAKGVIRQLDGHSYAYVKDWEKWVRDADEESRDDPVNRLVGVGERRFIAFILEQFGISNSSRNRSNRQKVGTKQSPRSTTSGTIESPAPTTPGTGWSPMVSDGSDATPVMEGHLAIHSSSEPAPPDPLIRENKKNSVLSTEHKDRVCVRDADQKDELDELRDTVAKLTEDDNLADVFRDQIGDWMTSGMTAADVRQAIMLARQKLVSPRSYVAFVAGAAKNIRNDRLTTERQAKAVPEGAFSLAPAAFPARPTKAQRNAAVSEARRASMAKLFPPKEASDGSR